MLKNKKISLIKKFDKHLKKVPRVQTPSSGWINTLRRLLNMSMDQLGSLIDLSGQGVYALEQREQEGRITLQKLRKAAKAFDMELVYAFIPHTSLEQMVDKKCLEKATEIVKRSHQNMKLEAQEVDDASLKEIIDQVREELKSNLSSTLWQ